MNLPADSFSALSSRAPLLGPAFIVVDKPVSALDVFYTGADTEPNRGSKAKLPHDHDVYLQWYDRSGTYLWQCGCNVSGCICGTSESGVAFRNIQHPYIKALISAIPVIDLSQQKRERTILQGDIPATLEEYKECRFAFRCSDCQVICKNQLPKL